MQNKKHRSRGYFIYTHSVCVLLNQNITREEFFMYAHYMCVSIPFIYIIRIICIVCYFIDGYLTIAFAKII